MNKSERIKQLEQLKKAKPQLKWVDSEILRLKQEIIWEREINGAK